MGDERFWGICKGYVYVSIVNNGQFFFFFQRPVCLLWENGCMVWVCDVLVVFLMLKKGEANVFVCRDDGDLLIRLVSYTVGFSSMENFDSARLCLFTG